MLTRGRLIYPFFAEIAQLDVVATDAVDPDGPSKPLTTGYDDVFREPYPVAEGAFNALDPDGDSSRQETLITVPVQVSPEQFDRHQMFAGGDQRGARITLWAHFTHLEDLGLIEPHTNAASIRVNDRLAAIYKCVDEERGPLVQQFEPPHYDLRASEVMPRGFGLSGGERNLLRMIFEDREQGAR